MNDKRPPLDFDAIKIAAHGNWINTIFPAVGIQFSKDPKKHQPCPYCGGHDRFRCDDKNGTGSWICNQCGSGNGFKLVSLCANRKGYELMELVGGILGINALKTVSLEQREKWKREQKQREQVEFAQKIETQNNVAILALNRWNNASMTGNSDYLLRKQIIPFGVRFEHNKLLVPVVTFVNGQQQIRNIQSIADDGQKLFMAGGQVKGCFCSICFPQQLENPDIVLICEGYATGISIFLAINQTIPVFIAFNAGNLVNVGQVLRQHYPQARIIFCADNDSQTAGKTGKNPGVESAKYASQLVNGEVIIPNFPQKQAVA